MEPLSSESELFEDFFVYLFIAIYSISDNWISDRCEMDSYLMCPSREEINLKERILIIAISSIAKLCFSKFWIDWFYSCHLLSIVRISSYVWFDISILFSNFSYYECEICLLYCTFGYLELECMHSSIILGDDDKSRCILVEAVDDAWSLYAVDDRWIELGILMSDSKILEVIEEGIHERPYSSLFPWCWMCVDARIFVDDGEVIILKNNIERHILGYKFHLFYLPLYLDDISPVYLLILGKRISVTWYLAFLDHLLEITTRLFGKKSRQVSVDSSRLAWVCEDAEWRCDIVVWGTHDLLDKLYHHRICVSFSCKVLHCSCNHENKPSYSENWEYEYSNYYEYS